MIGVKEVKRRVKALTGYSPGPEDEPLLELAIEDRVAFVLAYCNRRDIPKLLRPQLLRMIAGEFLYRKKSLYGADALGFDVLPFVTSIKDDETSVTFGGDGGTDSPEAALDKYIDWLRRGDAVTLQEFRRLKW